MKNTPKKNAANAHQSDHRVYFRAFLPPDAGGSVIMVTEVMIKMTIKANKNNQNNILR